MRGALKFSFFAIAAMLTASSALAHHSFAMFDQSKTVTIQGTVKDFRWNNPHVLIQMMVKNDSGVEEEWSIEMTSPEHLARVGWKPVTLKPGDKITLVDLYPIVTRSAVVPSKGYGLKRIAQFVGVKYSARDAGGAQSIVWFQEYQRNADRTYSKLCSPTTARTASRSSQSRNS